MPQGHEVKHEDVCAEAVRGAGAAGILARRALPHLLRVRADQFGLPVPFCEQQPVERCDRIERVAFGPWKL